MGTAMIDSDPDIAAAAALHRRVPIVSELERPTVRRIGLRLILA